MFPDFRNSTVYLDIETTGLDRYFGRKTFSSKMKEALGFRAAGSKITCADDTFELREVMTP